MKSLKIFPVTLLLIVVLALQSNTIYAKEGAGVATISVKSDDGRQQQLESNKKVVKDFIQELYMNRDSTAIDKYIADNIKQHNFVLADGKAWLKNRLNPFLKDTEGDKMKVEIKQIAADGDKVWTLSREVAPNGKIFARAEIWRIENGKIAEHWLVYEAQNKTSLNKNGMF